MKNNVYQKLQDARIKLQSVSLNKSGKNAFAKYSYFELSDYLPQIQSIFNDIGLCGVISFTKEEATLTIVNIDDTTQIICIKSPMAGADLKSCHPIQNLGAVQTYQRRYLWQSALEIVEHDALEATTGMEKQADYAELLRASKNRGEFERNYKSIPESRRKEFAELAKEIGAKYPKLTEVAA